MPTVCQKTMDIELSNIPNTYVILDLSIVTKGNQETHCNAVRQVQDKSNKANLRLMWEKCRFAQPELEWLGYKWMKTGIQALNTKIQALTLNQEPKSVKYLRSYVGAVNKLN